MFHNLFASNPSFDIGPVAPHSVHLIDFHGSPLVVGHQLGFNVVSPLQKGQPNKPINAEGSSSVGSRFSLAGHSLQVISRQSFTGIFLHFILFVIVLPFAPVYRGVMWLLNLRLLVLHPKSVRPIHLVS